ncbi:aspartate--tRNA ligase [Phocicoccus pinnipedialis]|uniref:Aspartate--tRNA ligase n=1 Tax=Phocicoccus pinnipedialis TaxID=110845 RepID=A0A6V7REN1_9BACL|nr:aspartate--tRNA ligase [Jeotgalicoccus pinnipedialis]MBP1939211.1 aspartyl-tRNA synthetase [Jeotgalicoccus pinnipedialis]CAD2076292.1 Aspartate--tRNA ligase [Jeotgalicoccus pinnipedialis]
MKRSLVNEITEHMIGEKVKLNGWVQRRRDLGGLIFIDLRDASGFVQIVFNPDVSSEAIEIAETLRTEFVIEAIGEVVRRDESQVNKNNALGHLEVIISEVMIISKAATPPFQISDDNINEDIRLKYRYVDLKRSELQNILRLRHKTTKAVREFLDAEMFVDIETPFLSKSTPEGARDYLVPSRIHEGEFYALPQSPQIYKQLLMLGGFERYYQIVKCFRDEDLRADRQPEFTQIDIEKSFTDQEDIIEMNERLISHVMKEVKGLDVQIPFPRMTHETAMNEYGLDKPDTRFDMKLKDLSEFSKTVAFKVFKSTVENSGVVKAIVVKNQASEYSRKNVDQLEAYVKNYGAKGLAWLKYNEDTFTGPIAKFFEEREQDELKELLSVENNDLVLFVADKPSIVHASLGNLRNKLAKDLGLLDKKQYNFVWITDWPLFEYDEERGRYIAAHHPFTSPKKEDEGLLETNPTMAKANAYDIVLNGYELGGGSIRISDPHLQEKMFKALGFTDEERDKQFGFLIEAFKYGAPPHGGIAYGLDRFVMLLAGTDNIRDVIAFPKTTSASDLMMKSPSTVSKEQLEELHIDIIKTKEDE